jgi:drug/metabolite transporter (DMT)-like permease
MPGARREASYRLGAAAVTVLLWSSSFVGIRADRALSPGVLALGRLTVATLALTLMMRVSGERRPGRDILPGAALCGALWFAAYNLALNQAEHEVDAGIAAMIVYLGPLLIIVLAGLFLGEKYPPLLLAGAGVAFAGTVLIALASARHASFSVAGIGLSLLAALGFAGGAVAQKPLLRRASPLQVTWLACLCGTIVCLPFAPALASQLPHASASSVAWLIYLGAGPTAIAFLTWGYALAQTTTGKMGTMTYLVPALAVLLGWLILREAPPALAIAGGALSLAGVAITGRLARTGERVP